MPAVTCPFSTLNPGDKTRSFFRIGTCTVKPPSFGASRTACVSTFQSSSAASANARCARTARIAARRTLPVPRLPRAHARESAFRSSADPRRCRSLPSVAAERDAHRRERKCERHFVRRCGEDELDAVHAARKREPKRSRPAAPGRPARRRRPTGCARSAFSPHSASAARCVRPRALRARLGSRRRAQTLRRSRSMRTPARISALRSDACAVH